MKAKLAEMPYIPIRNKSILSKMYQHRFSLLLFLPCFIYFILFKYLPMFGIIASFKQYSLFNGLWASPWVGFKYYQMFFASPDFLKLMRNTFLFGIYGLIITFPSAILFALVLNEIKSTMFKKFAQTASYLPHFLSNVVVSSMVIMFLSPTNGLINQFLGWFGKDPINFLGHAEYFRSIYVLSDIWQTAGWGSIIFIAALTGIDPSLYESAEMDGANRWKKLVHITLPGILPTIIIMFILHSGGVLAVGFEKVFLLYNPAVYSTADVLNTYIFRVGLKGGNFGYGTAIDMFTSIVGLLFVISSNYISRKVGDTSLW